MIYHNTEYNFFYESHGYSFFLEDFIIENYISWPMLVIGNGSIVKKYIPAEVQKEGKNIGLQFTKNKIQNGLSIIQNTIEKLKHYQFDSKTTGKSVILEMFNDISTILSAYATFDILFSEGIYANNTEDERSQLIEQSKNVIRDDLDYVFFKESGWLHTFLKFLSQKYSINTEDIHWYRKSELLHVINSQEILNTSILSQRKNFYLFDRQKIGEIMFFEGEEAHTIINNLYKTEDNLENLKGIMAQKNDTVISGEVCVIHRDYSQYEKFVRDMDSMKIGSILVTTTTDPEFMPAMRKAKAIITDIGGLLSHAAISARELNIPCIVGTKNATKVLKTGDLVELDGKSGSIKIL